MERKSISKKVRFEIFKRDKFTCQYCGSSAPEVVLEIDHINPVSKGGKNDLLNLVTSCYDCNRGKRDKKLTDDSEIKKQENQIKLLAEKQSQLKMIIQWREELLSIKNTEIEFIRTQMNDCIMPKFTLNETFANNIKKWLNQFDVNLLITSIDASASQYIKFDNKGEITEYSANKFLEMIPKIAYNKKLDIKNKQTLNNYDKAKYLFSCLKRNADFYHKITNNHLKEIDVLLDEYDYDYLYSIFGNKENANSYLENKTLISCEF